MAEIATTEPSRIRAGDTIEWRREDLSDYPASEWTLKYYLLKTGKQIIITAIADDDNFAITVTKAVSALYAAGIYSWLAKVYQGVAPNIEEHTIGQGTIEILPDLTVAAGGYDTRSHAKIMLDAIEAALQGKATAKQLDQLVKIIADIHTQRNPELLIKWRQYYKNEYWREQVAEKLIQGLDSPRRIGVRFKRI